MIRVVALLGILLMIVFVGASGDKGPRIRAKPETSKEWQSAFQEGIDAALAEQEKGKMGMFSGGNPMGTGGIANVPTTGYGGYPLPGTSNGNNYPANPFTPPGNNMFPATNTGQAAYGGGYGSGLVAPGNTEAAKPPEYYLRSGQRIFYSGDRVFIQGADGQLQPLPDGEYTTREGERFEIRNGRRFLENN